MSAALAWIAVVALGSTPADLPEQPIRIKTLKQTFNTRDEFALSGGRIWFRPVAGGEWKLLLGTGLPNSPVVADSEDPQQVIEIAADANALIAIGADRRLFDAVIEDASAGKVQWNYEWGYPFRLLPTRVYLPENIRTWSFSLLNKEAEYTTDIDGNVHRTLRVDTVWAVSEDGRKLRFNDPWLPPQPFEFKLSAPLRGAFAIHSISASASTVFVMDRTGRMFTRHADYDTVGGNPGIRYSYQREDRGYRAEDAMSKVRAFLPMFLDVRTLPPEGWIEQPRITGRFTSAITILQNGKGNDARELRVEGVDASGKTGYWRKALKDAAWSFVVTEAPLAGTVIDPSTEPEPEQSPDECLSGTAAFGFRYANERPGTIPLHLQPAFRPAKGLFTGASLEGFNDTYEAMTVRFQTPEGAQLAFTVHQQPGIDPLRQGKTNRLLGMMTLTDEVKRSPEKLAAALRLPGVRTLTDAHLYISDEEIRIEADPSAQPQGAAVVFTFKRPEQPSRCVEVVSQ